MLPAFTSMASNRVHNPSITITAPVHTQNPQTHSQLRPTRSKHASTAHRLPSIARQLSPLSIAANRPVPV